MEYRLFAVDDVAAGHAALDGIGALLNCAGPFMRTAEPLMQACMAASVHYLDLAAKPDSYQLAEKLDQTATASGVLPLPGSGGSVAMLGSLAPHAAKRAANPRSVSIVMHVAGGFSRGSAVPGSENLNIQLLHRVDGELVSRSPENVRDSISTTGLRRPSP